MTRHSVVWKWCYASGVVFCGMLVACQRTAKTGIDGPQLIHVSLQTDWYPQPEHGGFYDAVVKGYYRDEGLDVKIVPGGPYVNVQQQVATGATEFGMGASDKIIEGVASGLPLVAIGATMQHDPQAIMVHAESAVRTFADLEGHTVAIQPGSTWFQYLVNRYQLKTVKETPTTFSVANFVHDPGYIQQCFVTSEPYFANRAGSKVRTLLISDTGYNPYRVFLTTRPYLKQHPEIVAKFVRASLKGWRDYMTDPAAANALIARLNPAMSEDWMEFSYKALRDGKFVTGDDASGAQLGQFDPARWETMAQQLYDLRVIDKPIDATTAYTTEFLKSK